MLATGAALVACAPGPELTLRAGGMGTPERPCYAYLGDTRVSLQELASLVRRRRPTAVSFVFDDPDTAYRCVGGAIFEAQRGGARRIAFIAEALQVGEDAPKSAGPPAGG